MSLQGAYEVGGLFNAIIEAHDTKLLIVFDQFERFFSNVEPQDRAAFLEEIKGSIDTYSAGQAQPGFCVLAMSSLAGLFWMLIR